MGRARTWLGVVVSMSAVNGTWTNIRHGTDGRAPPLHHASLSLSAITDTAPSSLSALPFSLLLSLCCAKTRRLGLRYAADAAFLQ